MNKTHLIFPDFIALFLKYILEKLMKRDKSSR